jgi:hypothetical protein
MCDYSLQNVKSRAAKVGDKLTTRNMARGREDLQPQKMRALRSAFYQERSYLFLMK